MTPKVTLRKALEDPELLGSALAGPTWHAWRALLLAAMGEPLNPLPNILRSSELTLSHSSRGRRCSAATERSPAPQPGFLFVQTALPRIGRPPKRAPLCIKQ